MVVMPTCCSAEPAKAIRGQLGVQPRLLPPYFRALQKQSGSTEIVVSGYVRGALLKAASIAGVVLVLTGLLSAPAGAGQPACMGKRATIVGTSGDDTINGTPGNDVVVARGGTDYVSGKGGDDVLCGGAGTDMLYGGSPENPREPGNDTLSGGSGNDTLEGGGGNDTIRGGGGIDVLSHTGAPGNLQIDTAAGSSSGFGIDNFSSIEHVIGGLFNDTILGAVNNDSIDGSLGNDTIQTFGGADQAFGGEGDDTLDLGTGMDHAYGGMGTDTCLNAEAVDMCEA